MTDRGLRDDEVGSGTVLVLALIGVLLVLLSGLLALGAVAVARHQAEAAADLAALAAVDHGCGRAAMVAAADGGALSSCRPLADGSYLVRVTVSPALGAGFLRALGQPVAVGVSRAGAAYLIGES